MATEVTFLADHGIDVVVETYSIIGTDVVIHDAWERLLSGFGRDVNHATVRTFETEFGKAWYGKVKTRRPNISLEAYPAGTTARIEAVREHYREVDALAAEYVRQALAQRASMEAQP